MSRSGSTARLSGAGYVDLPDAAAGAGFTEVSCGGAICAGSAARITDTKKHYSENNKDGRKRGGDRASCRVADVFFRYLRRQ